ncbi:hypothetical protein CBR_g28874 [Chara braunii]|uniref:CCHC-type domain-containing protein n=1 Tax=Chara braunii TaxID=69332 RepID=A0A388LA43_CHABU|nr:hypothetical protein CBR_g28874 [Chara braunii]|eukprot:GBG79158.1 hypothetical protein CBR_g28874 [Chara braunii]
MDAPTRQKVDTEVHLQKDLESRVPMRDRIAEALRGIPVETRWADQVGAEERGRGGPPMARDRASDWGPRRDEEGAIRHREVLGGRTAEDVGGAHRWGVREAETAWASGDVTGRNADLTGRVWRDMGPTRWNGQKRRDTPGKKVLGGDFGGNWRHESGGGNQGAWRSDRDSGINRGSDWGSSHWKDERDDRWGNPPQNRPPGSRPEEQPARVPPLPGAGPASSSGPSAGTRPPNPTPRSGCVYCNDENHIKRECPHLTEALRLGVVKLNENKWVVWADDGEPVLFYPSMKVNVDKRIALQEEKLKRRPETSGTAGTSGVQMAEPAPTQGISIREPQVSSIKFVETFLEEVEADQCLRVRTQARASSSEEKGPALEKSGTDGDQPMTDAKIEEKKEAEGKGEGEPTSPRKRGPKKVEMKCTLDEIDTVVSLRRTLMQPMQCTLLKYLVASKNARDELLSITKKVRISMGQGSTASGNVVAKEGAQSETTQSSSITMETLSANCFSKEEITRFYVLGSGQLKVAVNGRDMRAFVDNGYESNVCRSSIARELGLEIDKEIAMSMVVADNKLQSAEGVCHKPVIEVAGVEAIVPIFSVKECSSELILGRTWLSAVHATTVDLPDGSQTLSIQPPDGVRVVLRTVDAQDERNRTNIPKKGGGRSRMCQVRLDETPFSGKMFLEDKIEVEEIGDRIVINGVGYGKESEEEEFEGCVKLSFWGESL